MSKSDNSIEEISHLQNQPPAFSWPDFPWQARQLFNTTKITHSQLFDQQWIRQRKEFYKWCSSMSNPTMVKLAVAISNSFSHSEKMTRCPIWCLWTAKAIQSIKFSFAAMSRRNIVTLLERPAASLNPLHKEIASWVSTNEVLAARWRSLKETSLATPALASSHGCGVSGCFGVPHVTRIFQRTLRANR
jgi:hypothetical protein